MSARWIWITALLGLAACEPRDAAKQQDDAVQQQGNQAATVAALPPGQRDGVFFRAIRDAGLSCQDVIAAQALPSEGGAAQWRVTCEDHAQHLISIPPKGPATVASRPGR